MPTALRIGRIDYLNVQPFFAALEHQFSQTNEVAYHRGHPSELNAGLKEGTLDLAPSSSFEYLRNAEHYSLLPGASVSARGAVQSVLFVSPIPLEQIQSGQKVLLTTASASSVALLKILWHFAWELEPPQWGTVDPGQGIASGTPFLEIGDAALRLFCNPPAGWYVYDLAEAWHRFTGLPFVFAVWIVRSGLDPSHKAMLHQVARTIADVSAHWPGPLETLLEQTTRPNWLDAARLRAYWRNLVPCLGPDEQAGLLLFAKYATELGLLPGTPGLNWALTPDSPTA